MRIGILTAGGDCPGLNAAICTVARLAGRDGNEALGIRHGFKGLAERELEPLELDEIESVELLSKGGTMLGASSFDPFREESEDAVVETVAEEGLDAVIAIGGEHSMDLARQLHTQHQLPIVGVPKTIDNDVTGTDFTFGFDTAVAIATEAIDRLNTTAESHDRVIVVEVMGRNTGWIALWSGLASGADLIVIPEVERTVPEICDAVREIHAHGKDFSIVVVAEGASLAPSTGAGERVLRSESRDEYGYERLGGIAVELSKNIEAATGFESRATILGHVQRGGTPTATDRVRAVRLASRAYEAAVSKDFGTMVALQGSEVGLLPLAEIEGTKQADLATVEIAKRLGLV